MEMTCPQSRQLPNVTGRPLMVIGRINADGKDLFESRGKGSCALCESKNRCLRRAKIT